MSKLFKYLLSRCSRVNLLRLKKFFQEEWSVHCPHNVCKNRKKRRRKNRNSEHAKIQKYPQELFATSLLGLVELVDVDVICISFLRPY